MRAALSDSLSSVVGQKASDPILFENLLIGAPTVELSVVTPFQSVRSAACGCAAMRLTLIDHGVDLAEAFLAASLRFVP